ncbi:piggyBac transposable element-derived protein 3-like [Spodoptera litura]|uniref:PiggyBac transposable element-derived protein 3-like n=1 Tax=Spodoptera litura TaxID=69820 RepID=A0A9J7DYF9_SPOLT|nr:piggyBac transposable element-derived protein 3-like [Spodoptera litura]
MSKRVFTKSNDYKGLEDALAALVSDSDDGEEYELVTIPPEPSCLTDEEEGDEDELVQNNLPRDVPGRVEVFVRKNLDHSPQWDEDDDEPLSTLQRKRPRVEDQEPRWHKCQPTYDVFYGAEGVSQRQENVKSAIRNLNPVQIFEKLFDDNILEMIVHNSELYSSQNNRHDFHTTF